MVKSITGSIPKKLPLLLIEDDILLPTATVKISLTSEKSVKLIDARILKKNSNVGAFIGVVPEVKIGTIGTVAAILQVSKTTHDNVDTGTLLMTGLCRFRINRLIMEEPYPVGTVMQIDKFSVDEDDDGYDSDIVDMAAELRDIVAIIIDNLELSPIYAKKMKNMFQSASLHALPDMCVSLVKIKLHKKLEILNAIDIQERYKLVMELFEELREKILSLQNMDASKKFLFIQDKTVKVSNANENKAPKFLKPDKPGITLLKNLEEDDNKELEQKLKSAGLPENVNKIAFKEFRKLCLIPKLSPESSVLRGYLELLADLPWNKEAFETLNIQTAKELLNKQHYGLDKLKQRILEYLAVRQLRKNTTTENTDDKVIIQDPVLCLVGPPGVGKTSIAQSIALALGRPFCRISLGGINNQADIRGHRRTYVGAMPGRIIQAINQAHVKNPVILLDEIDKMTSGIHGSPAAALLEVLDPAQNFSFLDHYINVPFDLSQIMFIATANTDQNIPPALKDRLEVFNLPGYTHDEKIHIAEKHLLPKQIIQNGLKLHPVQIPLDTIKLLVNHYTREAGVRNLERKLGALCRAIAVCITENIQAVNSSDILKKDPIVVDVNKAQEILGPFKYETSEWVNRLGRPGISVGLGWSPVGGSILLVEVSRAPGKGKLSLTGHLGTIMKESAKIAWGWLRSHANQYNIPLSGNDVMETDVYIHFPAGAVGKDGPSAGAAIACALFSLFSQRPLLTCVAMTGELTLQGVVLPVGGVKEKILAAYQGGFTKIIIPKLCQKYLLDIPQNIKDELEFVLVSDINDVLQAAFENGVEQINVNVSRCKL